MTQIMQFATVKSRILLVFLLSLLLGQAPVYGGFSEYHITPAWTEVAGLQAQKLKVVLDLDNTLVWEAKTLKWDSIDLGYLGTYDLIPGAIEFLVALVQLPNVEISFFSGASAERNQPLINEILDRVWAKYEILILPKYCSNHNLTRAHRHDQGKKDLTVTGRSVDLDWTLLVDDNSAWVMAGQEKNWVGVNPGKSDLGTHNKKCFLAKNKLVPALGLIALALENANRDGISPVEALEKLREGRDLHSKEWAGSRLYFERGLLEFKKVLPSFVLDGDCDLATQSP
jgi:hypothetical protein